MARRKNPDSSPERRPNDGGAVLLTGAGGIGPAGPNGESAGVALTVDRPLVVLVDSCALVDVARRAILETTRDHMYEGRRPDGGPQRPLSKAAREDPRRVSPHRGMRTGHMADELRATAIRGDAAGAESTIRPPTDRNVFLATEAERGVEYLGLGPAHVEAAERAIGKALDVMLAGLRVEPEQGEPTAAEEAEDGGRAAPARRQPDEERSAAARRGWDTRRRRQQGAQP